MRILKSLILNCYIGQDVRPKATMPPLVLHGYAYSIFASCEVNISVNSHWENKIHN